MAIYLAFIASPLLEHTNTNHTQINDTQTINDEVLLEKAESGNENGIKGIRNKVGGNPEYMVNPPKLDTLTCCCTTMSLLLQLYAPEDEPINAYHRVIYTFCCLDCHSLKILRSQLPRENTIYDISGNLKRKPICASKSSCNIETFRFPELELEEEEEPDEIIDTTMNALYVQGQGYMTSEDGDAELEHENETITEVDETFLKFQKRISRAPDQVLRYHSRCGDTMHQPLLVSQITEKISVPQCPYCLNPRIFEFQILPQLLLYLKIDNKDSKSIDWGTILVYTCSRNCNAANTSYATEYSILQNFSNHGLNNLISQTLQSRDVQGQ